MSRNVKKYTVRITHKNDPNFQFSGFWINKEGYFITCKHPFPSLENISNYRIHTYDGKSFRIMQDECFSYSKDIDLYIFKAITRAYKTTSFATLSEIIKPDEIIGNCSIFGYPMYPETKKNICSSSPFHIRNFDEDNSEYLLDSQSTESISYDGYSGSPIFRLDHQGEPTDIIGIYVGKTEGMHTALSINLIKEIGFSFEEQQRDYIQKRYDYNTEKLSHLDVKNSIFLDTFKNIHYGFEHELIKIENLIDNQLAITKETMLLHINSLLSKVKNIFDKLFKADVAITIFVLLEDGKKTILYPSYFESSNKEKENNKERMPISYIVFENQDISMLQNMQKDGDYHICSAFNEAYNKPSQSWINNDLEYSEDSNHFYDTTSLYSFENSYSNFYDSISIFPIIDKDKAQINTELKGFLVIDCYDKGSFVLEYINAIGGYISHKLNRFLSKDELKILLSKT